jgi:hypothetical protein
MDPTKGVVGLSLTGRSGSDMPEASPPPEPRRVGFGISNGASGERVKRSPLAAGRRLSEPNTTKPPPVEPEDPLISVSVDPDAIKKNQQNLNLESQSRIYSSVSTEQKQQEGSPAMEFSFHPSFDNLGRSVYDQGDSTESSSTKQWSLGSSFGSPRSSPRPQPRSLGMNVVLEQTSTVSVGEASFDDQNTSIMETITQIRATFPGANNLGGLLDPMPSPRNDAQLAFAASIAGARAQMDSPKIGQAPAAQSVPLVTAARPPLHSPPSARDGGLRPSSRTALRGPLPVNRAVRNMGHASKDELVGDQTIAGVGAVGTVTEGRNKPYQSECVDAIQQLRMQMEETTVRGEGAGKETQSNGTPKQLAAREVKSTRVAKSTAKVLTFAAGSKPSAAAPAPMSMSLLDLGQQ